MQGLTSNAAKFCMVWRLMLQRFRRVKRPKRAKILHALTSSAAEVLHALTSSAAEVLHALTPSATEALYALTSSAAEILHALTSRAAEILHALTSSAAEIPLPRRPVLRRRRGHLKPNCKDSAPIVFEEMATLVPVL